MHVKPGTKISLRDFEPGNTSSYDAARAKEETDELLKELRELQYLLHAENRRSLLIVLQGMDTSGKDGTIRNVMDGMTPLGVNVTAFKAPHEEELAHDFLWRVHKACPRRGYVGIFNRSHYEDVLVVRVHKLVPKKVWQARYEQINEFEKMLALNDTIILKFFLHISKEEQKERLQERLDDPTRYWKFSLKDVDERRYWQDYRKAYEDCLSLCSTEWAPWYIIPADKKWYRNLCVARIVVEKLRSLNMKFPEPTIDLSKVVIE